MNSGGTSMRSTGEEESVRKGSHFFAYLSRMKFIHRWGLMRNTWVDNIQEHSLQVAMIAHALAVIRNRLFAGRLNPERVMLLAVYHEVSEVITGDLPSPIKYFDPQIKRALRRDRGRRSKEDMGNDPGRAEGLLSFSHLCR